MYVRARNGDGGRTETGPRGVDAPGCFSVCLLVPVAWRRATLRLWCCPSDASAPFEPALARVQLQPRRALCRGSLPRASRDATGSGAAACRLQVGQGHDTSGTMASWEHWAGAQSSARAHTRAGQKTLLAANAARRSGAAGCAASVAVPPRVARRVLLSPGAMRVVPAPCGVTIALRQRRSGCSVEQPCAPCVAPHAPTTGRPSRRCAPPACASQVCPTHLWRLCDATPSVAGCLHRRGPSRSFLISQGSD
jgi:hypothetical protein